MTEPILSVDSTAIRRAADVVDQAATAFAAAGSGHRESSPLTDGSLGRSDIARVVVAAVGRQLSRCQDATSGLAERSHTMAGAMQTTASFFEIVDSAIGGHR
ncbi:MAG TPA: hypothetical protein VIU11_18445 [Nakamurella sp.]